MNHDVSIVMPAYKSQTTIVGAVRSVLAQSFTQWELQVICDDLTDYEALLKGAGINDPRIKHHTTGKIGAGSSPARNVGLDQANSRFIAILDADDVFHPEKLSRVMAHFASEVGAISDIVSCGLQITDAQLNPLRQVGTDVLSGELLASRYKFTNISMDSMLVFDRQNCDPRYDASFPCLTDIEFLFKLFAASKGVFHIAEPLHSYTKQTLSITNGPDAGAQLIATKRRVLGLLQDGAYPFADPDAQQGMIAFYQASLKAEETFGVVLQTNPSALFEDHVEPFLTGL